MGVSGWVLLRGSPHRLICHRDGSGQPACRVERPIAGLSITTADLGVVRGLRIDRTEGRRRFTGTFVHNVSITFQTDRGDVKAFQRLGSFDAFHKRIEAQVTAFVEDSKAPTLQSEIPGETSARPMVLWSAFGLGAIVLALWVLGLIFPSLRPRAARRWIEG
jgi:hypothetical protein